MPTLQNVDSNVNRVVVNGNTYNVSSGTFPGVSDVDAAVLLLRPEWVVAIGADTAQDVVDKHVVKLLTQAPNSAATATALAFLTTAQLQRLCVQRGVKFAGLSGAQMITALKARGA